MLRMGKAVDLNWSYDETKKSKERQKTITHSKNCKIVQI